MGKSQTEALLHWPSDSEVNMVGQGLRFSCNDQSVEVIKLFIYGTQKQNKKAKASAAEVITLHPIVRAQAPNRPLGIMGE